MPQFAAPLLLRDGGFDKIAWLNALQESSRGIKGYDGAWGCDLSEADGPCFGGGDCGLQLERRRAELPRVHSGRQRPDPEVRPGAARYRLRPWRFRPVRGWRR